MKGLLLNMWEGDDMWSDILVIIILTICVITDIKERKIYNKVIFPSLVITLIMHIIINGASSISDFLFGFLVGLLLLIIPYFMGGIGAGDVKLLALIGAIKGPTFVVYSALYMAIVGGVIAIIILLYQNKLLFTMNNIMLTSFTYKLGDQNSISITNGSSFPYAIAIAAGVIINMTYGGFVIC